MKEQIAQSEESKVLLITIDDAAQRLSIGRSHIYQQMQLGRLRSVRIGRSRRILESDLEAFIADLLDDPNRRAFQDEPSHTKAAVKSLPLRRGRR
jgi:excisionase family DNA binding protein